METNLLFEHYNDCCSNLKKSDKERDFYFYMVIGLTGLNFLFLSTGGSVENDLLGYLKKSLDYNFTFTFSIITSIIWGFFLVVVLKYFRVVIFREKQLNYIHGIEASLNEGAEKKVINRESHAYLSQYPAFLSFVHFLYVYAIPSIILLVNTIKIWFEFSNTVWNNPLFLFDFLMYVLVTCSIVLYLLFNFKAK